ncbi:MAG: Type 1 glutamine amidotransferase-like domain-containing protein [Christensenellales bacterium]
MPTFMLTSYIKAYEKDENENRYAIPINNDNKILDNIKKYVRNKTTLVVVANNPQNVEETEERASCLFQSFKMSGIGFKELIVLTNKNKHLADKLISKADLTILSGGKISCQMDFFKEINLKKILEKSNALVIGISAGSMNLCNKIFNFPEELLDLEEPRITKGLGFYDHYLIPHFDGREGKYQSDCPEIDVVNDYLLPFSDKETLLCINNDSYIILDNGKEEFVGEYYLIQKRQIKIYNSKE